MYIEENEFYNSCIHIFQKMNKGRKLAIWGAGKQGKKFAEYYIGRYGNDIEIFDSNLQGCLDTALLKGKQKDYYIIVTAISDSEFISKVLYKFGFCEYNDFICLQSFLINDGKNRNPEYIGSYKSWSEAERDCDGYDNTLIINRVETAALEVKNGNAEFERDGVLFYTKKRNLQLCAWLLFIAQQSASKLNIIDFGGSLGSTFFQNKDFWENLSVTWNIIEQTAFVDFGKKNLENDKLLFYETIGEVFIQNPEPNVFLFSGVIQYLSNSREILCKTIDKKPKYIILERTPFSDITIIRKEIVKEPIYTASYPAAVLEEKEFLLFMESKGYLLEDTWESIVDEREIYENHEIIFKSMVFVNRK